MNNDIVPIYLRCFVEKLKKQNNFVPETAPKPNDSVILVFDTETTPDESKNLLFGSCGVWVNGKLNKFFVFYNDDLQKSQIKKLEKICSKYNVEFLSRTEFVEKVFYPNVFRARGKCIGFNLPFDISRLAIKFAESRIHPNGFSFKLSENPKHPDIVIKSLDSKSQFIEFTRPLRKKSEKKKPRYKGGFVDCKTLTFSLTNNSYNLEHALTDFECDIKKSKAEKHGIISDKYLRYNINDTLATYHLYRQAHNRYLRYCLNTEDNKLFSPASIGKGYLKKIGIESFFTLNPNFPRKILGYLMNCYYGGRTETRIRLESVLASYTDFTSMYPTVFVLLGMYKFLIAKKIKYKFNTKETQKLLDTITLEDISNPRTWKNFTTICRIVPDNDVLPVRSDYSHKNTTNIGTNYLKSIDGTSLWYSLPDLIASKLLSGKIPRIQDAISFYLEGTQENLREIEVLKGIIVKPEEDFIKKIIEERMRIKRQENLTSEQLKQVDINQNILKIIANATSYGIFIQIDTTKEKKKTKVNVYGLDSFELEVEKLEKTGSYFNPIMSIFLTASSRLILAASESLVEKNGGYVAYCDTDSVFISPDHVELVQKFFKPLNPYNQDVEMFKVEKDKTRKLLHNIRVLAISAKRYVLYDYDEITGEIIIYKFSSHGLGHLKGINHKQFWVDIILAYHHPEKKKELFSKYKDKFAISQLTITNWDLQKRFDKVNENRSYSSKIKPYNFATVGTACRQDPNTKEPIIPFLAEMDKDKFDAIPYMDFMNYKTGKIYPNGDSLEPQYYWKNLESVLEDYVTHPEAKLEGNKGKLKRKHLKIGKNSIRYIGKESNELEISEILGVLPENTLDYSDSILVKNFITLSSKEEFLKTGLSIREYYYLKKKVSKKYFSLKKTTLKKILGFIKTNFVNQAFPLH